MKTIFTEDHKLHDGTVELIGGTLVPSFECPRRAEIVIDRVRDQKLGPVIEPKRFGLAHAATVHAPDFVSFLEIAYRDWAEAHGETVALPIAWPCRSLSQRVPEKIDGRLGYYSFDAGVPLVRGTFPAAASAIDVALTGLELVEGGERAAFALCRPPGHHATSDQMGGYCYFNNAAIAAETVARKGKRVAILDVDYHHGNGTQAIFYDRPDVLFVSLHGHPEQEYPYFLGYADETGMGAGEGYNLNLPLRWGTAWDAYGDALEKAVARIRDYAPDTLVVSLGLDTFKEDPISRFKLDTVDYLRMGERIAALNMPTLFVFEGGYAVEALGVNTVNVLTGFEQAIRR
jgi:acetoin utilization deacetylase AcuC-like enzyme